MDERPPERIVAAAAGPVPADPAPAERPRRRDLAVALACGAFAGLMVAAAFAAAPLYDWFCRTTGFAGTPLVASAAPAAMLDRKITIRFDANVARGLPWRFEPEVAAIELRLGEAATVHYTVVNQSADETEGTAGYNVTPPQSGGYFVKINCFCFDEQRLKPNERREMAVVFYVDPALARDADQKDLNAITLSYTFFPTGVPQPGAATKRASPGRDAPDPS